MEQVAPAPHERTEKVDVGTTAPAPTETADDSWPPAGVDYEAIPGSAPRAPGTAWYDLLRVAASIDVYALYELDAPLAKPQDSRLNPLLPFRGTRGGALALAGVDAGLRPRPIGGTLSLRFGPTAVRYGENEQGTGLEYVKQAYATIALPHSALVPVRFDVGKFDSPFAAESLDSQENVNYLESPIYALILPHFHTGIVALWDPLPPFFSVRVLAATGTDRTIDNNLGKTYGVQIDFHVEKPHVEENWWTLRVGYLSGPELDDSFELTCPPDTRFDGGACVSDPGAPGEDVLIDRAGSDAFRAYRHLLTTSFDLLPDRERRWRVLAQFAYLWDKQREDGVRGDVVLTKRWAASLAASYEWTRAFRTALRGDYFRDRDGGPPLGVPVHVGSGTATFEWMPFVLGTNRLAVKPRRPLLVRAELRGDFASEDIFSTEVRSRDDRALSAVLSLVAHSE